MILMPWWRLGTGSLSTLPGDWKTCLAMWMMLFPLSLQVSPQVQPLFSTRVPLLQSPQQLQQLCLTRCPVSVALSRYQMKPRQTVTYCARVPATMLKFFHYQSNLKPQFIRGALLALQMTDYIRAFRRSPRHNRI